MLIPRILKPRMITAHQIQMARCEIGLWLSGQFPHVKIYYVSPRGWNWHTPFCVQLIFALETWWESGGQYPKYVYVSVYQNSIYLNSVQTESNCVASSSVRYKFTCGEKWIQALMGFFFNMTRCRRPLLAVFLFAIWLMPTRPQSSWNATALSVQTVTFFIFIFQDHLLIIDGLKPVPIWHIVHTSKWT